MKGHTMAVIQGNGVISRNGLLAAADAVVAVLDSPSKGSAPARKQTKLLQRRRVRQKMPGEMTRTGHKLFEFGYLLSLNDEK